jgi:hypothetical protein
MQRKKNESWFSTKNVVSLFFIMLMATSILAIWQGSTDPNALDPYNGHKISIEGDSYVIKTDLGEVNGYTYPSYLETITLEPWQLATLQGADSIVILFDPQDEYIAYIDVLRSHLGSYDLYQLGTLVSFAITQEDEAYPYDLLDCTTAPIGTLYFRTVEFSQTQIYNEDNCLVLEGATGQDLVYAKDRLVYTLYEIME